MGKILFKIEIEAEPKRNIHALDAMMRKADKFHHKNKSRGGAKNKTRDIINRYDSGDE